VTRVCDFSVDLDMFALDHYLTNLPAIGSSPKWESHDAAWCRRALHLWARAEALGHHSSLLDLFGYQWQISRANNYLPLLGDEPTRMATWTFAEIETAPNPLAEFWREDIDHCRRLREHFQPRQES
jgi:hypothetical protein